MTGSIVTTSNPPAHSEPSSPAVVLCAVDMDDRSSENSLLSILSSVLTDGGGLWKLLLVLAMEDWEWRLEDWR